MRCWVTPPCRWLSSLLRDCTVPAEFQANASQSSNSKDSTSQVAALVSSRPVGPVGSMGKQPNSKLSLVKSELSNKGLQSVNEAASLYTLLAYTNGAA